MSVWCINMAENCLFRSEIVLCITCCNSPHQWYQTQLDGTAPAPHDEHQPERLAGNKTLVQRGGLLQPNAKHNTQPATMSENSNLLWQNNAVVCSSQAECSECNLWIIPKIWGRCFVVSPGFFLRAAAASTSSGCRWRKVPRSWRESALKRWSQTAAGTDKCVSNQLCGLDLTELGLLRISPYEGLFPECLQSRTGAPPTSEPRPPAVPAWNSLWVCVQSGRLS